MIHGPAVASAHVKIGESCTVSGRVVGATDPSALEVKIEASDYMQAVPPVRVDAAGAFRISFSPLSCGTLPVMLDLTTRHGPLVDRRTVMLSETPRVKITELAAKPETVFGRLMNTGTGSVSVRVGVGEQAVSVGRMHTGEIAEFRLPRAAKAVDLRGVQLWVQEDASIKSHWAFSLDPVERTTITQEGRLHNEQIKVGWSAQTSGFQFEMSCDGAEALHASLDASFDGSPPSLSAFKVERDSVSLCGRHEKGFLECNLTVVRSALRLTFRNFKNGLQVDKASGIVTLRLRPQEVRFRFMPAYVYSKQPISYFEGVYGKQSLLRGRWSLPTRMLALETAHGTVGLVPDRDRCLIGIEQSDGVVSISAGEESTAIQIPVVAGDWFECFRYVVTDIYGFREPRQYRPLIDCVAGEANYLAHNEDIWSRTMQVVTSFPKQDYVYTFYGLSYTIPALYAWHQMTGDEQALARAQLRALAVGIPWREG